MLLLINFVGKNQQAIIILIKCFFNDIFLVVQHFIENNQ